MIIGIDPGASTGVALFEHGALVDLDTIQPHHIGGFILANKPERVIFEDSRLISHVYTTTTSRAAALKMARNVGEIDAWCKLIVAVCADMGVPCHGISPKHKGAKLDAKQFAAATGWSAKCNQNERDAAMVAWQYRKAK